MKIKKRKLEIEGNFDKITNLKNTNGSYSLVNPSTRKFIIKHLNESNVLENYLFKNLKERQIKDLFDYLNYDFFLLLDFKDKEVLNIGCGEGTESLFFAKYGAKQVYSFELNPERLNMLEQRAKKMNLHKKIYLFNGDFTEVKLKGDSFDIITSIGVLEWLPKKEPFKEMIQNLTKIRQALRKKGKVLVTIENRLNPIYFLGFTHHHEIPFAPLMPRFIANILTKLFKGKPYLTHTYTKNIYIKIFRNAGFKNIEIYPVLFGYQEPQFVINSVKMYWHFLRKYGFKLSLEIGGALL